MNARSQSPGTRSIDQTFLIGPELYLRAVELADAQSAPIWQSRPFPKPAEVSEEAIKARLEDGFWFEAKEQLLVACRRSDDRPVGSVALGHHGWRYGEITISLDVLFAEDRRDQLTAELLELLIPYTLNERNMMVAEFVLTPSMPHSEAVAARYNAKLAVRMREFRLVRGTRRDEHWYQTFNPVWVDLIGRPDVPGEGTVERDVPAPARLPTTLTSTMRSPEVMVVGERVVLRPFRPKEASLVEEWSRQETEVHFEHGRSVFNAHAYGHAPVIWARQDPPEVICFAIARRDNDELIGSNGLHDVDWVHRTAETVTELYRPEHRGAGLGTEAKHLLLEYAFDRLDMHMVHSYVSHTNPRSAAALRKQGYRDAGSLAWATLGPKGMNGEWIFDLLASEWRAAREAGAAQ